MNGTILLNYSEDTKKIEEEEKLKFLISLMEQMGVPVEEFYDYNILNIDQKLKLNQILNSYNIQIIDDLDGGISVYVDKEKVASFEKAKYKLKKDYSELDYKKQLFLEMEIKYFTIFDQEK